MNENIPVEKPLSNWAVAWGLLAFAAAFLLWAVGFDLAAGWIQGGGIETALNWVTGAWYWVALGAIVLAVVVSRLRR